MKKQMLLMCAASLCCATLMPSCTSRPEVNAKLMQTADLGLTRVLESSKLKPGDALLVKDLGHIWLAPSVAELPKSPDAPAEPVAAPVETSGKDAVPVLGFIPDPHVPGPWEPPSVNSRNLCLTNPRDEDNPPSSLMSGFRAV